MITFLLTLCVLGSPVGYWAIVAANGTVWTPSPARPFRTARRAVVAYMYSMRHLAAAAVKWLELAKNAASVSLGEHLQPAPHGSSKAEPPAAPRFDESFAD